MSKNSSNAFRDAFSGFNNTISSNVEECIDDGDVEIDPDFDFDVPAYTDLAEEIIKEDAPGDIYHDWFMRLHPLHEPKEPTSPPRSLIPTSWVQQPGADSPDVHQFMSTILSPKGSNCRTPSKPLGTPGRVGTPGKSRLLCTPGRLGTPSRVKTPRKGPLTPAKTFLSPTKLFSPGRAARRAPSSNNAAAAPPRHTSTSSAAEPFTKRKEYTLESFSFLTGYRGSHHDSSFETSFSQNSSLDTSSLSLADGRQSSPPGTSHRRLHGIDEHGQHDQHERRNQSTLHSKTCESVDEDMDIEQLMRKHNDAIAAKRAAKARVALKKASGQQNKPAPRKTRQNSSARTLTKITNVSKKHASSRTMTERKLPNDLIDDDICALLEQHNARKKESSEKTGSGKATRAAASTKRKRGRDGADSTTENMDPGLLDKDICKLMEVHNSKRGDAAATKDLKRSHATTTTTARVAGKVHYTAASKGGVRRGNLVKTDSRVAKKTKSTKRKTAKQRETASDEFMDDEIKAMLMNHNQQLKATRAQRAK